jgi:hypothetical protein
MAIECELITSLFVAYLLQDTLRLLLLHLLQLGHVLMVLVGDLSGNDASHGEWRMMEEEERRRSNSKQQTNNKEGSCIMMEHSNYYYHQRDWYESHTTMQLKRIGWLVVGWLVGWLVV